MAFQKKWAFLSIFPKTFFRLCSWVRRQRVWLTWQDYLSKWMSELLRRRVLRRLYWAITIPATGIMGAKLGPWAALSIFAIATLLHERGLSWLYDSEVKDVMNALSREWDIEHDYDEYQFMYEVSKDSRDTWVRYIKMRSESLLIAVKRMRFGARGNGSGAVRSFEKLGIRARSSKGKIYVIPGEHDQKHWYGNIVFGTPIGPEKEPRQINIEGIWPNLWAPLRLDGKDGGKLVMIKPCKRLIITIVLPSGIETAKLIPTSPISGNVTESYNRRGLLQLDWEIPNAEPGTYEYEVICEDLPAMIQKRSRPFRKD